MEDVEIKSFLIFDGAMGTMLQQRGLKTGELPEIYNITHSKIVIGIHSEYVNAGSQVVTTNTFGANAIKLNGSGYSVRRSFARLWRTPEPQDPTVALDVHRTCRTPWDPALTRLTICLPSGKTGAEAGADIILIETIGFYEAKAAVLAAENCVAVFMSSKDDGLGTDALTATLS